MNYLNKKLISLLGGALALFSPGCFPKNINLSRYPIEKPLVAGVDGFLSDDLNIVGSKLEKECSTPVVIEPVGNWQENMPEIRQAYKQGRNIILTGFSMGSEQVKFIAKRCREEGIIIELVFIIDPTYTSFGNLDLPDNVKRIKPYFSSDQIDFMSWARGNPERFRNTRGTTKTEKPTFLRGTHLNCVKWNNLGTDLIDEVKKYTK